MCSFWLVEATPFQKNWIPSQVAASMGAGVCQALSNLPQAFTHLALIRAAFNLHGTLGR